MTVRIHLHPDLCHLADGNEIVETSGDSVGDCIRQLIARCPALEEFIFHKDGQLQTFIEIYLNRKAAYPDELGRKVKDGDEIHLILTIAGG